MKIDTPVLKRLGPVPFWRGETKCLDGLEEMYRKAMASARAVVPDEPRGENSSCRPQPHVIK
jgi:hypothetical protein